MAGRGRPAGGAKTPGSGRRKGTSNKVTKTVREVIAAGMQKHLAKIHQYIEEIEKPKDKVDAIAKILPYIAPKLNNVDFDIKAKEGTKTGFSIVFENMGEDEG